MILKEPVRLWICILGLLYNKKSARLPEQSASQFTVCFQPLPSLVPSHSPAQLFLHTAGQPHICLQLLSTLGAFYSLGASSNVTASEKPSLTAFSIYSCLRVSEAVSVVVNSTDPATSLPGLETNE